MGNVIARKHLGWQFDDFGKNVYEVLVCFFLPLY